jgi:hypothetical protein
VRTSERLLTRLREVGLAIPEGSRLVRVNPSAAMRNGGAWSWFTQGPDGRELGIGSQFSMGELLGADALATEYLTAGPGGIRDTEVLPARLCSRCSTPTPDTPCRLCRRPYCQACFTDHHHEGYGTPAADTR